MWNNYKTYHMKNKIFVVGATGFQGGNIAKELSGKGYEVTTLTHSIKNDSPIMEGIKAIEGGLENRKALKEAMKGVDAAVYTFPLIFDMDLAKEYTYNFILAAKEEGVSLIVFNTGFDLPKEVNGLLSTDLKVEIKSMFDASGLNVITLVPDIYIDNISAPWSIPVILMNKIVPYPIASNKKAPWVSHADLAKFVASAVVKPELFGQVLPIGGNLYTGEEIAEAIAQEINQPINFVSMTPDEFEQQIAPSFGELAGKEISNLYRYIEQNRDELLSKDFKRTQDLLDVTPQSLKEWVQSIKWEL